MSFPNTPNGYPITDPSSVSIQHLQFSMYPGTNIYYSATINTREIAIIISSIVYLSNDIGEQLNYIIGRN